MRLSLGTKLLVSTSTAVLLVVVLGVTALLITNDLGLQIDRAVNETARRQMLAGHIAFGVSELDSIERGLALSAVLQHSGKFEQFQRDFERRSQGVSRSLDQFRALPRTTDADGVHDRLVSDFEGIRRDHYEVVRHLEQHKMDAALEILNGKLLPKLGEVGKDTHAMMEYQAAHLEQVRKEAARNKSISVVAMTVLTLLSMMVGGGVLYSVRRLHTVLNRTVEDLYENARHLSNAATQVSSSSQLVSQAAGDQAASLEETSSSAEELRRMTRSNAEHAESAAKRTQDVSAAIEKANAALNQMLGSMNEILASSNQISKIIKVIDDIAFQTNILALNAAVEAARAGEAGTGFAVVAEEVRSLAQRSAQAARDTAGLIEESMRRTGDGKARLDEVAASIGSVTGSAENVRSLVHQVHRGSEDQSIGIEQIAVSVSQMEKVTVQLAATSEETAASGHQLSIQARRVDQIGQSLKDLVGTGRAAEQQEQGDLADKVHSSSH